MELPINQIVHGNCLDVMKDWPDKCIDLILTDPPYGIGVQYDFYIDSNDNWTALINKAIPLFNRLASMTILPCCRIVKLDWIYANHKPDWLICWYKGSPGTRAWVGFNDWEPHLVYGKVPGLQIHDYFYAAPEPFTNGHPCAKPLLWGIKIINHIPAQLILDPFCGSGTTCVAAKMLGRNYIGIDISEKYCEIARQRLEAVEKGLTVAELKSEQIPLFEEK